MIFSGFVISIQKKFKLNQEQLATAIKASCSIIKK